MLWSLLVDDVSREVGGGRDLAEDDGAVPEDGPEDGSPLPPQSRDETVEG